ncbi:MAG: DUF1638 domain-containing protein [Eubacteriaceae bacterium]|nr:DUF1638 domain-containing protein [Eubacteriaceae bacterium]
MKRAIIGCGIIRSDIEPIVESLPYEADVFWLDAELHNVPENLKSVLQEKIDELAGYDEIIITYALCGNALLGIKSDTSTLIFIRGDDCIYADMCHRPDYMDLRRSSIFLSRGWLSTRRNADVMYQETLKKYGESRTQMIYEAMYGNYRHLVYMKLEDEVDPETMEKLEKLAGIMDTDILVLDGSIEMYRELLELKDSEHIARLEPGTEITMDIFR